MVENSTGRALILTGGKSSGLSPLSNTRPSTLIEFVNKPILFHHIDALIEAEVTYIVISIHANGEMIEERIKSFIKNRKIKVVFSKEDKALGVVGAIGLAKKYLTGNEPFFLIYGNVMCGISLKKMMDYHKTKDGDGLITIMKKGFSKETEKESEESEPKIKSITSVDTGIYIFSPFIFDQIPEGVIAPRDFYHELGKNMKLHFIIFDDFCWRVKDPTDFLSMSFLFLKHLTESEPDTKGLISADDKMLFIHPSVIMGKDYHIENNVIIGQKVTIGDGVYLNNCIILPGAQIQAHSYINRSIIGWGCRIGKWTNITHNSVIGENVTVKDGVTLRNSSILPNQNITE